jgi:hypothetical protein
MAVAIKKQHGTTTDYFHIALTMTLALQLYFPANWRASAEELLESSLFQI